MTQEASVRKALASNAVIYTIALVIPGVRDANPSSSKSWRRPAAVNRFARTAPREIAEVLGQIARDIRHTYTIGYTSTNTARDGTFRRVRVVVTAPPGRRLVVRSRAGYLGWNHEGRTVSRVVQRWLARLLIAVGAIVLMWVAANLLLTMSNRRQYEATLERMRSSPAAEAPVAPASLRVGEPIGTWEIARVGLSGVVVEGDDDSVLDRAIGHLPDTPLPGPPGTARWPPTETPCLDRCGGSSGDVLRLKTPHGDFDYVVRETVIVEPDELWVLDPTPVSMLTLISCYPFNFIGNAPKRFIVRAERMPTRPRRPRWDGRVSPARLSRRALFLENLPTRKSLAATSASGAPRGSEAHPCAFPSAADPAATSRHRRTARR